MNEETILLLGGDDRQRELFKILKQEHENIFTYGLFEDENENLTCDFIILPMPAFRGDYINAPYCKNKLSKTDIKKFIHKDTKIFGGMLPTSVFGNDLFVFDYAKDDELIYLNAALTAEAAIAIAINNSEFSFLNANILITGFGRIGKILANYLKGFPCNITVAARKPSDYGLIKSLGFKSITYENLSERIQEFNFVFNTVPYKIFDEYILENSDINTLFIDLASTPGGFDINKDRKIISALALPGKYSPATAAEVIYKTIRPFLTKEEKT